MQITGRLWTVWVIDDAIPVASLGADLDDHHALEVSDKGLPYRSHLLRRTLDAFSEESQVWASPVVRSLVEQLLNAPEFNVTGFNHPENAIRALNQGEPAPDLIIFDWEYSKTDTVEQHLTWIRKLLLGGFPFLCVYTHLSVGDIRKELTPLGSQYDKQFLDVYGKDQITVEGLIAIAQDQVQGTLAGQIAVGLRQVTEQAIGRALRRFARLPLEPVDRTNPKAVEIAKRAELHSLPAGLLSKELAVGKDNLPDGDPIATVVPVLSRIVEETALDSDTIETALRDLAVKGDQTQQQMFLAYELYVAHSTPRVLRGDITQSNDGIVRFVITPPCDLARFSSKTRNTFVFVELLPFSGETWKQLVQGLPRKNTPRNKKDIKMPSSISSSATIGTEGIYCLPSIPFTGTGGATSYENYLLIPYRISHTVLHPETCGYDLEKPLLYHHLETIFPGIHRVATLTDPYLSGLLWALAQTLFSPGTRDFVGEEHTRLGSMLWDQRQTDSAEP